MGRQRPDGTGSARSDSGQTGQERSGSPPSDGSSPDSNRVEGRPHPIQDSIHRAPSPRQAELGCTRRGRATPCSSSTEPRQLFRAVPSCASRGTKRVMIHPQSWQRNPVTGPSAAFRQAAIPPDETECQTVQWWTNLTGCQPYGRNTN